MAGVDPQTITLQSYYKNIIRSLKGPSIPSNPCRKYKGLGWMGFYDLFGCGLHAPVKRSHSETTAPSVVPKKGLTTTWYMVSSLMENVKLSDDAFDKGTRNSPVALLLVWLSKLHWPL